MPDDYASLGPVMKDRLDQAESVQTRICAWVDLLAERDREANLIAREICLMLNWTGKLANFERTTWPWERRG